jgi:outer membrane protein insertion porin family
VSEPIVAVDPASGGATIGIEVAERPANSILGALGYAPQDGGGGELTGRVEVVLGNIAGTGRRASAEWERPRRRETRIGFSYWEPWLLGAPIDVGVQGLQTVNDTIYTTTEGDLLVAARMGDRVRITWSIGGERYVPGAPLEQTTTSVRTSLGTLFDGTDVPGNPSAGSTVEAVIEYAAKEGPSGGERNRSGTARVRAGTYMRLGPRHVVALEAQAGGIESTEDDVPFHELLVLGGSTSLRGYREEQFRGTRTAVGTLEYRYLLGRRSRAVVFLDVGYYYRGGPNSAKDTKLGYGIGLRGETRLGTISLDYGLGEGDGLLDGKLHVGLIRGF